MEEKRIDSRIFTNEQPYVDLTPVTSPRDSSHQEGWSEWKRQMENRFREKSNEDSSQARRIESRLENMERKFNLLVDRFQSFVDEQNGRYKDLSLKSKSSTLAESRIEAMIERHNQIVSVFESRLSRLQKTHDEQKLKIMELTALLADARRVIERSR